MSRMIIEETVKNNFTSWNESFICIQELSLYHVSIYKAGITNQARKRLQVSQISEMITIFIGSFFDCTDSDLYIMQETIEEFRTLRAPGFNFQRFLYVRKQTNKIVWLIWCTCRPNKKNNDYLKHSQTHTIFSYNSCRLLKISF